MDPQFNLRERTALIVGPLTPTTQNLMMGLTQLGADVVLVSHDNSISQKFCQQLTDSREVNPKFGRALAIKSAMANQQDIKDVVGSAAQAFGSVDLYIDAMLYNKPNRFSLGQPIDYFDQEVNDGLKVAVWYTHAVLNFLRNRKRGRILYITNVADQDPLMMAARGGLISFAESLSKIVSEHNISVNVLKLGLTEEFVLAQYPEAKTIREAVEKLKQKDPSLKITEADKITNTILYLVSQFGAGVTGQTITIS